MDLSRMNSLQSLEDWTPPSNAVLKLQVEENVVRRIPASRIFQKSSSRGCYDRILQLAHVYHPTSVQTDTFTTTYIDEDGDVITISSDREVVEAWQQFIPKGGEKPLPLRVRAELKKIPVVACGERRSIPASPKNHIQQLLESIVTVLAKAIMTLQEHMANPRLLRPDEPTPPPPTPITPTAPPTPPQKQEDVAAEEVASNIMSEVLQSLPKQHGTSLDPEFIHARHTCDGCMKAPIVGLRYHAMNLSDYDLCEGCMTKCQGEGIDFQPMEDEKDRHRQALWKRRATKGHPLRRPRPFPAKCRRRNMKTEDEDLNEAIRRSLDDVPQEETAVVLPKLKAPEQEPKKEPVEPEQTPAVTQPELVTEQSLKTEPETTSEQTQTEPKAPETKPAPKQMSKKENSLADVLSITLDQCAEVIGALVTEFVEKDKPMKKEQKKEQPTEVKQKKAEKAKEEKKQEEESSEFESAVQSEQEVVTKQEVAQVEEPQPKEEVEQVEEQSEEEPQQIQKEEQPQETNEPETEPTQIEEPKVDEEQTQDPIKTDENDTEKKAETGIEASVALSEAISALTTSVVSEDECDNDNDMENEPPTIPEEVKATPTNSVSPSAPEEEETPTEPQIVIPSNPELTILEPSEQDDDDLETRSHSSWDLIDDQQSDQALARATQLIGSALFQSDLSKSASAEPEKPLKDDISIPSVESSVPTIHTIPIWQYQKWSEELDQLKELGFENDKRNVNVLEMLQATKVGENVTVTDAVDHLLSHEE